MELESMLLPTHIIALPRAIEWINIQQALQRAPNTVAAYSSGLDDYLGFCIRSGINYERAGRVDVAAYVKDMSERPPSGGRSAKGFANATLRQRLTIVRLFYDHLIEEGIRPVNPVSRGGLSGRRALISGQ